MTRKCEIYRRKMIGGQWQDQDPAPAAFHQFCQDEESACAIVEYSDGQVDVVPAGWVKFIEPERE